MAFVTDITSASLNSYVSVEYADTYFTERLFSDTWNDADLTDKQAALMWACKLIDTNYIWTGARVNVDQPMAFPRYGMYDAEGYYLSSDAIPKQIMTAACELAMLLLREDRTAYGEPDSAGITDLTVGPIQLTFDKADKKATIPEFIQNMMMGLFQSPRKGAGVVPVIRT